MINNSSSNQTPQALKLTSLGETYRHNLRLKQWRVRKEKSFKIQELERVEHHLERCLLLAGRNRA